MRSKMKTILSEEICMIETWKKVKEKKNEVMSNKR